MIPVTKPFLPPREEFDKLVDGVWERNWLTNNGQLVQRLEKELKEYLGLDHLLFVANGTIALQMAIKALELEGEIITTPFSFIATTSSIVWEDCRPVFVDIDKQSFNIDAAQIEAAITENTSAILATHVYGNPCDVEAIRKIANKHHLKVIYDAAHAFGIELNGQSIFEYGDISICSLHATKLYHSVEGGLLMTKEQDVIKKLAYMRNFGFDGPTAFAELGINGKNSEFHAAMGLANLKYMPAIHEKRKQLTKQYRKMLKEAKISFPVWHDDATKNYAYYPIVFESKGLAMECFKALKEKKIYARRYFYPSLARVLPYLESQKMPVTENIAKRVLCLPLYHDLSLEEIDTICKLIEKDDEKPRQ
jgi:dTDP-4-amino-4,6-dideoxygalactose transaminase